MIKRCSSCNEIIYVSESSKIIFCENCEKDYTKEEYDNLKEYYKIVMIGKWNGPNHFIYQMGKELKKRGHEIIHISRYDMLKEIQAYDLAECTEYKKPIPLRIVEYYHSPDIIFSTQQYMRYDNDCKYSKVIYHHREYTNHPDILNPDMMLWGYPYREQFYMMYFPYEYHLCKHKYDLFCGVNLRDFKPAKKIYDGLMDIGWHIEAWRFKVVNGPVAEFVIEQQEKFWEEATKKGITERIPPDIDLEQYKVFLAGSKFLLIDGGYYGWYTRRVYEAAACKTVMVIRIYNDDQIKKYNEDGLIDGKNCIFVRNIDELAEVSKKIAKNEYDYQTLADNAYEWVKNHTYKKRADRLLELIAKIV